MAVRSNLHYVSVSGCNQIVTLGRYEQSGELTLTKATGTSGASCNWTITADNSKYSYLPPPTLYVAIETLNMNDNADCSQDQLTVSTMTRSGENITLVDTICSNVSKPLWYGPSKAYRFAILWKGISNKTRGIVIKFFRKST